jgi:hypothetical protein
VTGRLRPLQDRCWGSRLLRAVGTAARTLIRRHANLLGASEGSPQDDLAYDQDYG